MFAKLWKATISFFISVCPSICMQQFGSHWADFYEIWFLSISQKYIEKIQVSLKSDKKKGYCIHFWSYFAHFFLEWKMFHPKVVENLKTHFLCSTTFFKNRAVYEMWPRELCVFLAYKVCRKPTHTNLYLHLDSHHHPANKQSVLASIIYRAKALCHQDSLTQELEFLTTVLKENGYSSQQIWRVLETVTWSAKTNKRPTSIAFIPYTQTTSGLLSRMLAKHNNKSVSLPPLKIYSYLPPVRNALGLRTLGVYSIPCECGQVYIAQSCWSI